MVVSKVKKNGKKIVCFFGICLFLVLILIVILFFLNKKKEETLRYNKIEEIKSHYAKIVILNKDANIYKLEDDEYIECGKISKDQVISLDEVSYIDYTDEYFKTNYFENEYYIYYKDVEKWNELVEYSQRYKNYIPYNENVVSKNPVIFYSESGELLFKLNESIDKPIIVRGENKYGIEYMNKLLYINIDDVEKTYNHENTTEENTNGIAVLNYHFFYDEEVEGDAVKCNQIICLSTDNLKKHLDYIKDNNIFTPTMKELEMYIDGYIRLPKSVVLTIDDGWRMQIGVDLLEEYQLNATVFLITSWWKEIDFLNKYKYVEYHSHGDNLHNQGVCPGGQGGAIKCLKKEKLLNDLSASREKLDNTTVFCYPFYEYNNYSIEVLKEAGFTMAFGGNNEEGRYKVSPGINKYKLPRYVIYNNTTVNNIASYIG